MKNETNGTCPKVSQEGNEAVNEMTCLFCNSQAQYEQSDDYFTLVNCPICGIYTYSACDRLLLNQYPKDIVSSYLYHNNKLNRNHLEQSRLFIGSSERFEGLQKRHPFLHHISLEEMKVYYPRTFSQRIDKSLLALSILSGYYGNDIQITDEEIVPLLFIKRFDASGQSYTKDEILKQYKAFLQYLGRVEYIDYNTSPNSTTVRLLADGWKQIERFQGTDEYNRDVFVSMSFAKEHSNIREAIRNGITGARFSPQFMDERIHNKQIVPEMLRMIRESRFLIMDVSNPNYGAYYEAGYAQGLGKEVIVTCSFEARDREFSEEEKTYAKYLRPHFDIAQKQILYWENEQDLTDKLTRWINALFS